MSALGKRADVRLWRFADIRGDRFEPTLHDSDPARTVALRGELYVLAASRGHCSALPKNCTTSALNFVWNAARSKPGRLVQIVGFAAARWASHGGKKS